MLSVMNNEKACDFEVAVRGDGYRYPSGDKLQWDTKLYHIVDRIRSR